MEYLNSIIKFGALLFSLGLLFNLETFFPFFKNPGYTFKKKVIHDLNNITIAAINSIIAFILYFFLIKYIFSFMEKNSVGLLNIINIPVFLEIIIGFILFDLWMYIWHLLNHKIKFLWLFHRMHHSDTDMDSTTAIRFHTGEIILSTITRLPVILLIGLDLRILLIYEIVLNSSTIFHHSNLNLPETIDNILMYVIVTPNMHRVHHSVLQVETDSNYSTTFSFWDRIFRTFKKRVFPNQISLGLKEFIDEKWQKLHYMLITPFININKMQ